jgi:hypothetical protein
MFISEASMGRLHLRNRLPAARMLPLAPGPAE